jgi:hypothetical protein
MPGSVSAPRWQSLEDAADVVRARGVVNELPCFAHVDRDAGDLRRAREWFRQQCAFL